MSIAVPDDKKDRMHDLIRRYTAFQISFRNCDDELYELSVNKEHKQEANAAILYDRAQSKYKVFNQIQEFAMSIQSKVMDSHIRLPH